MAKGDIPNPYVYDSGADSADRHITITVSWNTANRALTGAVVHRDTGCAYTKILVGVGADGTPNSSTRSFTVPAGDTSFTKNQMGSVGLNTIDDFLALQITAA